MRIKEAYPNAKSGDGIFTDMQAYDVPWENDDINTYLDVLYESHSGDKECSKIITNQLINNSLTPVSRSVIALSVLTMYRAQWTRLYSVLSAEYDPIKNYDMVETENGSRENSAESELEGSRREQGQRTYSDTGTIQNSGSTDATTAVYGFNSDNAVDSDEMGSSLANTETRNLAHTETPNITESQTESATSGNTENYERELTRSGNIGVTTSQQLLLSEIDLWKWSFFEQVFTDIDNVLCLKIY